MVLKLTLNEAMKSGEKELRTEHLLLGLLLSRKGRAASILKQLGISLRGVRKTVDSLREAAEDNQGLAYATPGVKNVIEIARAATRSGTQAIGSEHLLVGLLSQKRGVAAHILREHGVTLGKVRALLRRAEPQE
ncbi:MAG: hypothetical protein E6J45_03545 [Chloroflexi bacterium]|nr:MAG: hypothetical protein E6J45_03545 [Chloroflexota bacterium]